MAIALRTPPPQTSERRSLSLRALLAGSFLAILTPAVALLVLWAGLQLQQAAFEQAQHDLLSQAASAAGLLRDPLEDYVEGDRRGTPLPDLLAAYARATGSRVTVLDARSRVLVSSDPRIEPGQTIEGVELAAGQPAHGRRIDATTGDDRLFAAAPVFDDDRSLRAHVHLSASADSVAAAVRAKWATLAASGLVLLGAVTFLSIAISRALTGPLERLTRATETVAAGELEEEVVPAGPEEIRRLAASFNRMRDRVRQTLALQEEFVADAAHELRSPLASMRLRLELLEEHGRDQPDLVREYLPKLRQEAGNLQRLAEQLLTLSLAQNSERNPRAQEDLARSLYALADQYGPLAGKAGVHFTVDVPDHLPLVYANPEQIGMAVGNLLENAIKFPEADGNITLRASAQAEALEISVQDTGRGIGPEAQARIFERFYREDWSRQGRSDGAGLGLALAKAVADSHGGSISVTSTSGIGSKFTLRLPLESA
jgi:signal transduction histidine kinase